MILIQFDFERSLVNHFLKTISKRRMHFKKQLQ